MQNLKREKDSLREVNAILNRKMMEMAEEIKQNGVQIEDNNKRIRQIEKMMKVKTKGEKQ